MVEKAYQTYFTALSVVLTYTETTLRISVRLIVSPSIAVLPSDCMQLFLSVFRVGVCCMQPDCFVLYCIVVVLGGRLK